MYSGDFDADFAVLRLDILARILDGWLTVRLVGASFIRFGCAIRLCHLCDCAEITVSFLLYYYIAHLFSIKFNIRQPPRNCSDYGVAHQNIELQNYNAAVAYPHLCAPTQKPPLVLVEEEVPNSTSQGFGKKATCSLQLGSLLY